MIKLYENTFYCKRTHSIVREGNRSFMNKLAHVYNYSKRTHCVGMVNERQRNRERQRVRDMKCERDHMHTHTHTLSLSLSLTHTHAHTHARTHTHIHTHSHIRSLSSVAQAFAPKSWHTPVTSNRVSQVC